MIDESRVPAAVRVAHVLASIDFGGFEANTLALIKIC